MVKCCFYFTEDDFGYEEQQGEEEDDFSGDDLDSDDANNGEGSDDNSCKVQATSASREIEEEEMDPDELEENLIKTLKEMFGLPKVLIKQILCADDVKGDLEIARQRLQKYQDIENPPDQFKAPIKPKRLVVTKTPRSGGDFQAPSGGFNSEKRPLGDNQAGIVKGRLYAELQSYQEKKEKERRNKNNRHENVLLQREQDRVKEKPDWRKHSFEKTEEQMDGNQFYRHQDSKGRGGFRGRQRGGPGPKGGYRGGSVQSQRDKQEYRDDGFQENCSFGCQGDDYTRQPPGGCGNRNGQGNPPRIKPKPLRGPRGVARGGPREEPRGGYDHEEYQDADLNIREQANRERPGSDANKERGRGGMRRAQVLSNVEVVKRPERRRNEEDEARFEQNKLVVRGLSASTTDDGVLNFIEAMSGEEVKEVAMLGKGKALVTMVEQITSKCLRSP